MKKNLKVAFYTLGCKVNQYDSELLKDLFVQKGYDIVGYKDYAHVYVINTCIVTHIAERKSRQNIRKVKKINPDSIIAVVGCYPQTFPEKVKEIEEVDVFLGTDNRSKIIELIESIKIGNKDRIDETSSTLRTNRAGWFEEYENVGIKYFNDRKKYRSRHFIKVQEGCERFCSYCIVPHARGKMKSRPMISVINEAREAVSSGFKELVLTGSNLGAYGQESFYKPDLVDLIKAVTSVNSNFRVRLSSIEPMEVGKDLIQEVTDNPKVCPHLHIPLQSADNKILQRMNRPYTNNYFIKLIDVIMKSNPDICLTTDVIVGFPGEKDKNFERTKSLVKEVGFADLHVFQFSKREKTPAKNYPEQVNHEIKEQRSIQLIKLAEDLKIKYQKKFLGKKLSALIETKEGNYYTGLSENYLKLFINANESKGLNLKKGEVCSVKPYFCAEKVVCKIIN